MKIETKVFFAQAVEGKPFIDYNSISFNSLNKLDVEIKKEILNLEPEWRTTLLNWQDELCVIGQGLIEDWWYSTASRISAWYPYELQEVLFTAALRRLLLKNKFEEIYLDNVSISGKKLIERTLINKVDIKANSFEYRSTIRFIFILLNLFFRLVINSLLRKSIENVQTNLIYTHILNPKTFKLNDDHYYGDSFDKPNREETEKFSWLYFRDGLNLRERYFLRGRIPEGSFVTQTILTVNTFSLLLGRALAYLRQVKTFHKKAPTLYFDGVSYASFTEGYLFRSLNASPPLNEIELELVVKKLSSNNQIKTIIFPFECKGVERALIKGLGPDVQTVGYAHAVHNLGHLYLKYPMNILRKYWPDYIAATGDAAKQWLTDQFHIPADKVINIGSKRNIAKKVNLFKKSKKLNILFVGSQGYEMNMLANYFEQKPSISQDFNVSLRIYPYHWLDQQEQGVKRIQGCDPSVICESDSYFEQIQWASVVFFCSTSAGVEAILAGRLGVQIDLNHIYTLDLFKNRKGRECIEFIRTTEELEALLNRLKQLSETKYLEVLDLQKKFCEGIYSKPTFEELFL